MYNITGGGEDATATVTINAAGNVSSVSVSAGGTGYVKGDILGITTANVSKGKGAQLSVSGLGDVDTLYLTNVQGETFANDAQLYYYNTSNARTVVTLSLIHI